MKIKIYTVPSFETLNITTEADYQVHALQCIKPEQSQNCVTYLGGKSGRFQLPLIKFTEGPDNHTVLRMPEDYLSAFVEPKVCHAYAQELQYRLDLKVEEAYNEARVRLIESGTVDVYNQWLKDLADRMYLLEHLFVVKQLFDLFDEVLEPSGYVNGLPEVLHVVYRKAPELEVYSGLIFYSNKPMRVATFKAEVAVFWLPDSASPGFTSPFKLKWVQDYPVTTVKRRFLLDPDEESDESYPY